MSIFLLVNVPHIFTEQQIVYYNDGQLCDELGALIITAPVPQNDTSFNRSTANRRLFSPVQDRTPAHNYGTTTTTDTIGHKNESPETVFDSNDIADWWDR